MSSQTVKATPTSLAELALPVLLQASVMNDRKVVN